MGIFYFLVPKRGLEPPRLAALPPQGSASANFATWAQTTMCTIRLFFTFQVFIFFFMTISFFRLVIEIFSDELFGSSLSSKTKSKSESQTHRCNKTYKNRTNKVFRDDLKWTCIYLIYRNGESKKQYHDSGNLSQYKSCPRIFKIYSTKNNRIRAA